MAYILKKRIKGRTYYYLAETQRVVSGHREGAKNGKGGFVNGSGQVDVSVNHRYLARVDT